MLRPSGWIIALATLLAGQAALGAAAPPAGRFEALVVGVVDGDTLDVLAERTQTRIRIEGIDCPELGQPFGRVAKRFASDLVFDKRVEILPRTVDRYGRLVARVRVSGTDVGLALLQAGLAWHYTTYSQDPLYASAERAARAARQGLWAQEGPTPPWVQRRHPASPEAPARPAPPHSTGSALAGPFHGNLRSLVFHAPGCLNYNCQHCTAVFATAADAIARGFRPAQDCQTPAASR